MNTSETDRSRRELIRRYDREQELQELRQLPKLLFLASNRPVLTLEVGLAAPSDVTMSPVVLVLNNAAQTPKRCA